MDGCGPWRIYWKIMLPLSTPGPRHGGDLLLHLDLRRLPRPADLPQRHRHLHRPPRAPRLRRQLGGGEGLYGELFAMSTLSLVPVFVVFLAFQRLIIRGVAARRPQAVVHNARNLRLRRLRHQPRPHLRPGRRHARRRLPPQRLPRPRGRPRRRVREEIPAGRRVADERAIIDDPAVRLVVGAGIPAERAGVALRAMRAGKDAMVDKPGCTTEAQLAELRRCRPRPAASSRSATPSTTSSPRPSPPPASSPRARIGRVVSTIGLGPHRVGLHARPDWFWDTARGGAHPRRHRLPPVRAVPRLHRLDRRPRPLRRRGELRPPRARPAGATTATPPSPPTTPRASSASTG